MVQTGAKSRIILITFFSRKIFQMSPYIKFGLDICKVRLVAFIFLLSEFSCVSSNPMLKHNKNEGEVVRHLRQRLGVLIVRDNAAMMASRHPTFAPQKLTATQINLYILWSTWRSKQSLVNKYPKNLILKCHHRWRQQCGIHCLNCLYCFYCLYCMSLPEQ